MLKTERNTTTMEARVKAAANKHFGHRKAQPVFDHGQWWVVWYDEDLGDERTFSVNDAEGPGTTDGFSFEEC